MSARVVRATEDLPAFGIRRGDRIVFDDDGLAVLVRSIESFDAAELVRVCDRYFAGAPSEPVANTPTPPAVDDSAAVDHLLANLDEEGPTEPRYYELFEGQHGDGAWRKVTRRHSRRVERVRARYNADLREQGKDCPVCGEHFKPRRVDQVRCSECIDRAKQAGGR